MAVYKVPQNVEAEDKLLGPFTFKQFIFLIGTAISGFLTWQLAMITPPLALITLPFTIVFGILGVYRRDDQPVEIYLLSLLRFYIKPRTRLWNQTGMVDLVKITAPKVIEKNYTDGLSQGEVKNRLKQLATVMDTRGWSSRNATLQDGNFGAVAASDRLLAPVVMPGEPSDIHESDDPLYEYGKQYEKFDRGVEQATEQIKQQAMQRMQQQLAAPAAPVAAAPAQQPVPAQAVTATGVRYNPFPENMHQKIINPAGSAPVSQPAPQPPSAAPSTSAMTAPASPDILRLAQNDDRNVASIQREADNELHDDQTISLH